MGWSFRIGRLAGIDIYVHFTFLLLLGWVALTGFVSTGSLIGAAVGLVLIGIVFFIIVLHELGHALAARYYGIPTRDITLLPIGGVARLERMPEKPTQELVVALAGPAVNVALAAILWPFVPVQDVADPAKALSPAQTLIGGLAEQLLLINVFLVVFNLLPAFPMDGGRVLRALLAMRLSRPRATQIAARVGQGMAVLFGIVAVTGLPPMFGLSGLDPNPMLLLVAVFVWFGAQTEARAARFRSGLTSVPVGSVMRRDILTVDPDDTLDAVLRYVRRGIQQDFPVVVSGQLVGLLSRTDLRYGLSRLGPAGRVFQASRREFPTLAPVDPAEHGLALISQGNPAVPVLYYGRLVGLLTAEDLSEYLWAHRTEQPDRAGDSAPPAARSRV